MDIKYEDLAELIRKATKYDMLVNFCVNNKFANRDDILCFAGIEGEKFSFKEGESNG